MKHPGLTVGMLPAGGDPTFEGATDERLVRVARSVHLTCADLYHENLRYGTDKYVEVAQLETAVEIRQSIMLNYWGVS